MLPKSNNRFSRLTNRRITPRYGKFLFALFATVLIVACITGIAFYNTSSAIFGTSGFKLANPFENGGLSLFETKLKGQEEGRTNILLIGQDMDRNTDTIIVLSYYHDQARFATMTLPRDLLVDDGYGVKKINSVWSVADYRLQEKNADISGERFLATFLENQLGIPIHYTAKINIEGLANIIDQIEGIEIEVENSFTDCEFPTPNYMPVYYPSLGQQLAYLRPCPSFEQGKTVMDSTTALIYARSRKSFDNPLEAIDFARSKRQVKVIEAIISKFKQKIQNGSLIFDPAKATSILGILKDNFVSDLNIQEIITLSNLVNKKDNQSQIAKFSINFDGGVICPQNSSSDLIMCDGSILGQEVRSASKTTLQKISQNLIEQSQWNNIYEQRIAIVGNGSEETDKILTEFKNLGFPETKIALDNTYGEIDAATLDSQEIATIYVPDEKQKSLIEQSIKLAPNWSIVVGKQSKYTFSQDFMSAGIVVLIEPKIAN